MPIKRKVVQVTIEARDFKRLKQWSEADGITPEILLGRLIRDERLRRARQFGGQA